MRRVGAIPDPSKCRVKLHEFPDSGDFKKVAYLFLRAFRTRQRRESRSKQVDDGRGGQWQLREDPVGAQLPRNGSAAAASSR
jgi:hypothetical protein